MHVGANALDSMAYKLLLHNDLLAGPKRWRRILRLASGLNEPSSRHFEPAVPGSAKLTDERKPSSSIHFPKASSEG
jgi:hypothetical protein